MKIFYYKNERYIKVSPVKSLFKSTTIWEIVNRGDVFAVRLRDLTLTVIPGDAEVEFAEADITNITAAKTQ